MQSIADQGMGQNSGCELQALADALQEQRCQAVAQRAHVQACSLRHRRLTGKQIIDGIEAKLNYITEKEEEFCDVFNTHVRRYMPQRTHLLMDAITAKVSV